MQIQEKVSKMCCYASRDEPLSAKSLVFLHTTHSMFRQNQPINPHTLSSFSPHLRSLFQQTLKDTKHRKIETANPAQPSLHSESPARSSLPSSSSPRASTSTRGSPSAPHSPRGSPLASVPRTRRFSSSTVTRPTLRSDPRGFDERAPRGGRCTRCSSITTRSNSRGSRRSNRLSSF